MVNKKSLYLFGVIVLTLYLISLFLFLFSEKNKSRTCEANVSYVIFISKYKFTFNGNVLLHIKNNRDGYVFLSGFIDDGNNNYFLSQHIEFDYLKTSSENYHLTIKRINQTDFDNIPEYLTTSLHDTMGLSGKVPVYFFTENENHILWGTLMSPMMSCVVVKDKYLEYAQITFRTLMT